MYCWLPTVSGADNEVKGGSSEIFLGDFVLVAVVLMAMLTSLGALLEVAIFVGD